MFLFLIDEEGGRWRAVDERTGAPTILLMQEAGRGRGSRCGGGSRRIEIELEGEMRDEEGDDAIDEEKKKEGALIFFLFARRYL